MMILIAGPVRSGTKEAAGAAPTLLSDLRHPAIDKQFCRIDKAGGI